MKFIKITALLLAVLMLSVAMIGCESGEQKETKTINVTVSVVAPDKTILEPVTIPVTYTADEPATVMIAVTNALDENALSYVLSDDENHINAIEDYADAIEGEGDAQMICFWEYTLNGVASADDVSAGTNLINDGDKIVYTYVKELASEMEEDAE